jgi:hypothetical protein
VLKVQGGGRGELTQVYVQRVENTKQIDEGRVIICRYRGEESNYF